MFELYIVQMIVPKHLPVDDVSHILFTWESFGEILLLKMLYRALIVVFILNVMVSPLLVVRGEETTRALFVRDAGPAGQKVDDYDTVVYIVDRTVIFDRRRQVPLQSVSICGNLCLLPS